MNMTSINTDVPVGDIVRGWTTDAASRSRVCVFCGERFERGRVYRFGDDLLTSARAADRHVADAHGGSFAAIMAAGPDAVGLGEVQAAVLRGLFEGMDDQAIAASIGDKALSTIRNHRRNLRRKAAEARLFIAVMELVESRLARGKRFVDFGPVTHVRDERADMTEAEADAIVDRFMQPDGSLSRIPPKEKHKLAVLRRVVERFERGRDYSDAEVRAILAPVNEDHALLRRYLVDYRFLERDPEGRRYRRV